MNKPGFSIIEILLSIALLGIISAIAVPVYYTNFSNSSLRLIRQTISESLRSAHLKAELGEEDSDWSVYMTDGVITIYKGIDYANRDSAFDIQVPYSGDVVISGLTDVHFSRPFGYPVTSGSLFLDLQGYATQEIQVTEIGSIFY